MISPTLRLMIPLLLTSIAVCAGERTAPDFPDLGDPAAAVLPLAQERRLAPVILRQLRTRLPLIEDLELNEYLTFLGNRLLAANTGNQLSFHFLLVDKRQINAFATPGGIVVVNSGLLLATESESELAGVLAHEIAHVTHRHIARMLAEEKNTAWAGYLAAILSAVAAAYDSRLAQLGAYAGTTLSTERFLSYSRAFEHEADQAGMRLMSALGYDPASMITFFQKLQAKEADSNQLPEFLRTHPLTINRISSALNRSSRYQGKYRENSREFPFMRVRLEALTDRQSVLSEPTAKATTRVGKYRRAVALMETGKALAASHLLETIRQERDSVAIELALAKSYTAQNRHEAALALLRHLDAIHPGRESIVGQLGEALLRAKKPAKALTLLRPLARRQHSPAIDKLVARAASENGLAWLSHKHMAEYYEANGRISEALRQLTLAAQDPEINKPALEEIRARKKTMEKLQKEMMENR